MSMNKRNLFLALGAVAAGQLLFLSWMVWERVSLLKHGREIVLPVQPLDPRDMFRGDYVILGYPISTINHLIAKDGALLEDFHTGSNIYVTMTPDAGTGWKMTAKSAAYPATVAPSDVVLKGRIENMWGGTDTGGFTLAARYGIENYFVPESTGAALEQQVREKKIEAVIAVGDNGKAAIKALMVDGKRIHEQPAL